MQTQEILSSASQSADAGASFRGFVLYRASSRGHGVRVLEDLSLKRGVSTSGDGGF